MVWEKPLTYLKFTNNHSKESMAKHKFNHKTTIMRCIELGSIIRVCGIFAEHEQIFTHGIDSYFFSISLFKLSKQNCNETNKTG